MTRERAMRAQDKFDLRISKRFGNGVDGDMKSVRLALTSRGLTQKNADQN